MRKNSVYLSGCFILFLCLIFSSWDIKKKPETKQIYGEIKIGNQIWMSRNLDVVTFRNGDTIPEAKTKEEWLKAGGKRQPAWCYFNNDPANGAVYGRLYNWYAVSDPRGLAPEGWHVPSSGEWLTLRNVLGGKKAHTGKKLKSITGWDDNGNGTDSCGFKALPGGSRMTTYMFVKNQGFDGLGNMGLWWSSIQHRKGDDVFCFVLYGKKKEAKFWWDDPIEGLSVRCVKN